MHVWCGKSDHHIKMYAYSNKEIFLISYFAYEILCSDWLVNDLLMYLILFSLYVTFQLIAFVCVCDFTTLLTCIGHAVKTNNLLILYTLNIIFSVSYMIGLTCGGKTDLPANGEMVLI